MESDLYSLDEAGNLTYTLRGLAALTKAFALNGINIHDIKTERAHKAAFDASAETLIHLNRNKNAQFLALWELWNLNIEAADKALEQHLGAQQRRSRLQVVQ